MWQSQVGSLKWVVGVAPDDSQGEFSGVSIGKSPDLIHCQTR